jgi:hypothetical protein
MQMRHYEEQIFRMDMNKNTVRKGRIQDIDSAKEDLHFWLSRPPEERIAAVEFLRRQWHGSTERLQRVVRIIKRA